MPPVDTTENRKENKPMANGTYEKIPLAEQLHRAYRGGFIHPEYPACAVRALGEMPMDAYLKDAAYLAGLAQMLALPQDRLEKMTLRETAVCINRLKSLGVGELPRGELLHLLAAPLWDAYRAWKEAQTDDKEETP
jgi:hypothetical protein